MGGQRVTRGRTVHGSKNCRATAHERTAEDGGIWLVDDRSMFQITLTPTLSRSTGRGGRNGSGQQLPAIALKRFTVDCSNKAPPGSSWLIAALGFLGLEFAMSDSIAECSSLARTGCAPWVQDVLPFLTSLSVHAFVVVVGLLTYQAVRIVTAPPPQDQSIIPESVIIAHDPPGGVPFTGGDKNPFKRMTQDETPDSTARLASFHGGSSAGQLSDVMKADATTASSGDGFAVGARMGTAGYADDGGIDIGAVPFGAGSGGAIGLQGQVFGHRGNARTIIFVCDCTGSMISKIAQLKIELSRAVQGLEPIQSFNIIFYQDEKVLTLSGSGMLAANPQNIRKAETWLGEIVTAGNTDPVPALTAALMAKPQLLYFLTDAADFPNVKAVQNTFTKLNSDHRTKVNTILFVESKQERDADKESEPLMRGISNDNGGVFKSVILSDLR
jgi:hypothetical protein